MISREAYEKFMREIQQQIDDADRLSKQNAEKIIRTRTDIYNNAIAERVAQELQLAQAEARAGNLEAAEKHKLFASIYQSVLRVTSNSG